MSINFHPDFPNSRYIVVTTWGKEHVIYNGNNRDRAVEITNFWDEKCNTYFYDLARDQYDGFGRVPVPVAPLYSSTDVDYSFKEFNAYMADVIARSASVAEKRLGLAAHAS